MNFFKNQTILLYTVYCTHKQDQLEQFKWIKTCVRSYFECQPHPAFPWEYFIKYWEIWMQIRAEGCVGLCAAGKVKTFVQLNCCQFYEVIDFHINIARLSKVLCFDKPSGSTGCPTKHYPLFWLIFTRKEWKNRLRDSCFVGHPLLSASQPLHAGRAQQEICDKVLRSKALSIIFKNSKFSFKGGFVPDIFAGATALKWF